MNTPDYAIDRRQWAKMNVFTQMGNIYSEVGRSINAKRRNNLEECNLAVGRAIDLFDATVELLVQRKSVRTKEVLRAKDQFLHAIYDTQTSPQALDDIDRYFMQYAIAARLNR